jgi:hypothetical protein
MNQSVILQGNVLSQIGFDIGADEVRLVRHGFFLKKLVKGERRKLVIIVWSGFN